MKVLGRMINDMAKAWKGIVMEIDTRVILLTINHMVQGFMFGPMEKCTRESGQWD